ncbi:hypothetical protein [Acidovorax cavernicola]|uniref:Uncharacterized protein n=1 Tax=Acidovorax cavernicola TaxID=1675792 RepID=A0A9X8D784_9BURK|nr:hypothetical protein D3H34_07210 [Acidovorax cavernicola]
MLYKQVSAGDAHSRQLGAMGVVSWAKFNAWAARESTQCTQATAEHAKLVASLLAVDR